MKGFIVTDFYAGRDKAISGLGSWLAAGKLNVEGIVTGRGRCNRPRRPLEHSHAEALLEVTNHFAYPRRRRRSFRQDSVRTSACPLFGNPE
jgi:hypothetical protein